MIINTLPFRKKGYANSKVQLLCIPCPSVNITLILLFLYFISFPEYLQLLFLFYNNNK
ncbi:hypothetical protein CLOSYM_02874 [[Clostridium] symbiosum ATCC 14940]|uniref:Uncharacterized protein n=1 Tax=[Clostridium] symbiosum ATCC 14940 TaxID=411472 RepID=A0ABC9TWD0_CLOSY|nr:hypothetical protein CLOSYM_02874 [[Clostridium] symbiosum ATCC 14940]